MPYLDRARQKQFLHEHYLKNKDAYYRRSRWQIDARRQILHLIKEKNPCTDCGYFYPYFVMEFDHRTTDKEGNINRAIWSWSLRRLLKEIQKCDIVCSNCHAFRTHRRMLETGKKEIVF